MNEWDMEIPYEVNIFSRKKNSKEKWLLRYTYAVLSEHTVFNALEYQPPNREYKTEFEQLKWKSVTGYEEIHTAWY